MSAPPVAPGSLAGRHAFVTGGGSGIGAAVARRLAAAGARVSLAGRRREALDAVHATLGGNGASVVPMDVRDIASVREGCDALARESLAPDIVVHSAGIARSAPYARTDDALLLDHFTTNVLGIHHVTQALLPAMTRSGGGRIVAIASTAGLTGYSYVSAYVASKHAVVGLVRALARELARTGVTVNAVCPGYTDTPLTDGAVETVVDATGRTAAEIRTQFAQTNPLGRLVRPEEVAETVAWLCAPESAMITGQAIVIAGGELLAG